MKDKSASSVIYVAVNALNGKRYIGVTSRGARKRMQEHFRNAGYKTKDGKWLQNGAFYRAIRKYGKAVFVVAILERCASYEEALKREVAWIARSRPEYNSTFGGDGYRGISPEGRARHLAAVRGNTWRRGKTHTEEVRLLLRDHAIRNFDKFKLYTAMGPKASSKPVACLDDGKQFESASAAARNYGVAQSALVELCLGKRGRRTVGSLRFAYAEVA